jgi:hypothetical protein
MKTIERQEYIGEIILSTKNIFQDIFSTLYDETRKKNKANKFILKEFQIAIADLVTSSKAKKDVSVLCKFDIVGLQRILDMVIITSTDIYGIMMFKVCTADFILECLKNIAREIWSKPILFYHRVSKQDYVKNMMILEKIIASQIKYTAKRINKLKCDVDDAVLAAQCAAAATATLVADYKTLTVPQDTVQPPLESATIVQESVNDKIDISKNIDLKEIEIVVECDASKASSESNDSSSDSSDDESSDSSSNYSSDSSSDTSESDDDTESKSSSEIESEDEKKSVSSSSSSDSELIPIKKIKTTKNNKKMNKAKRKNSLQKYKNYLNPDLYIPRRPMKK